MLQGAGGERGGCSPASQDRCSGGCRCPEAQRGVRPLRLGQRSLRLHHGSLSGLKGGKYVTTAAIGWLISKLSTGGMLPQWLSLPCPEAKEHSGVSLYVSPHYVLGRVISYLIRDHRVQVAGDPFSTEPDSDALPELLPHFNAICP